MLDVVHIFGDIGAVVADALTASGGKKINVTVNAIKMSYNAIVLSII